MPAITERPRIWTVAVTAEGDLRDDPVDGNLVERLVDIVAPYAPAISHLPRRYSVRLTLSADSPLAAGEEALEVWAKAVEEAGLPVWPVTKLEVTRTQR